MAALFNLTKQISGSVGTSSWIDLGLIPSGYDFWVGSWTCSDPAKAIAFNLYTNNIGQSSASALTCKLLATVSPKTGSSVTQDLYKRGALHTSTIKGTGTEHWWVNLTSKSNTSGTYNFTIYYTQE